MRERVLAALFWLAAALTGLALNEVRQREDFDALRGITAGKARAEARP